MNVSDTTLIVSTPRSGQHFLAKNLEYWHPTRSIFCEGYECLDANRKSVENCPSKYSGSIRLSCSSGRAVVKNHDFNLDLDPLNYRKVVILLRRDWYAILISWYLFELTYSGRKKENDSPQVFEKFVIENLKYLFGFTKKYLSFVGPKYKHIYFEDHRATKDPLKQLVEIFEFIFGESPNVTNHRGRNKLRNESNPLDFKYYDEKMQDFVNSLSERCTHLTQDEFLIELNSNFPKFIDVN